MYCTALQEMAVRGSSKEKNMARCHMGDHRRYPSLWITFLSNHRAFDGLFLRNNTEFSTAWVEFPEQGKYIPLVFHGQELMNLWKVSNANNSHIFKGHECSQLSHTSAFLSRWVANQPTFKGGIRASWELLVRNFLAKHLPVKTAMQGCYQRTAGMERCAGFKSCTKNNFEKLTFQKVRILLCSSKTWFQPFGLQFVK